MNQPVTHKPDTLGYHRELASIVFGEDSPAVTWLDAKIAESPNGEQEQVIAHETQVVALLMAIHKNGLPPDEG